MLLVRRWMIQVLPMRPAMLLMQPAMPLMRPAMLLALLLTLPALLLTLQIPNPDTLFWTRRGPLIRPPFFLPMARATLWPHSTPDAN